MSRMSDVLLAMTAPVIWGTTYIVTTELLPPDYPLTIATLRALPAGLVLLLVTGRLPPRQWIWRLVVLGGLNFAIFWTALFVAAYRLPGGVAATLGAIQPLLVLFLARAALGTPLTAHGLFAAVSGIGGVALLVLGPRADLDWLGIIAALAGAGSMALGVVLTRKWKPDVSALTFTAWQLTAGGTLLLFAALLWEPALPVPSLANTWGFLWLGGPGAALSYFFWFRGIERLGPAVVTNFGFLSPLTAIVLGWVVLDQGLTAQQFCGAVIVLVCVWLGGQSNLSFVSRVKSRGEKKVRR